MTEDEDIEKIIDEALIGFEIRDEHIKRRKPQQPSFRFLSPEESKVEIEKDTIEQVSIMTKPDTPVVTTDKKPVVSVGGDINAIEDIIRKHQESRKFNEK